MSSPPILFVGVGKIGEPIARRLIARGLNLQVSDSSPDILARLAQQGLAVVQPEAISRLSQVRVLLCLPDAGASAALIDTWIKAGIPKGAIVADLTTMPPSTARHHAEIFAAAGGAYLDAPVSGGQRGAESGDMVVVASGLRAAFDTMRPIFDAIGNTVHYAGEIGAASLAKAINQYVYLSYNFAFAQGLKLGHELGLADDVVLDLLTKGAPGHPLINDRLPSILASAFHEGFLLKRCLKDLDCLEFPDQLPAAAREDFERLRSAIRQAVEDGLGDRDILALSRR